jgi:hypothetical protein
MHPRHRRPHVLGFDRIAQRLVFKPAVQMAVRLLVTHARMRALVIDGEAMQFRMRGTKKLGHLGSLL